MLINGHPQNEDDGGFQSASEAGRKSLLVDFNPLADSKIGVNPPFEVPYFWINFSFSNLPSASICVHLRFNSSDIQLDQPD